LKDNLINWKASYEGSEYIESTVKVSNILEKDISLYYRHYKQKAPIATIFIFHGLGESSLFYGAIATKFHNLNYEVFAMDQQAHGKSHGKESRDIGDFNILYQNAWAFVFKMLAPEIVKYKDIPLFFLGVGIGASTILEMQLNIPKNFTLVISGVILLSPSIILIGKPNTVSLEILKFSSYILPTFNAKNVDYSFYTQVQEVHKIYTSNPDKFAYVPSTLGRELIAMADHLLQNITKFTIPTLLMHGSSDRVTDKRGSETFAEKAKIDDITFVEYADAEHLLLQEYVVLEVEQKILDWISKKVKK